MWIEIGFLKIKISEPKPQQWRYSVIAGLFVLFPIVTLVGYFFIGQSVDSSKWHEITLFHLWAHKRSAATRLHLPASWFCPAIQQIYTSRSDGGAGLLQSLLHRCGRRRWICEEGWIGGAWLWVMVCIFLNYSYCTPGNTCNRKYWLQIKNTQYNHHQYKGNKMTDLLPT